MAGQDVSSLAVPSSTHRLPTVSASHALHARGSRAVSTGLTQLNRMLSPAGLAELPGRSISGGYLRGKVTEVFGPSGVGKTAFGIQAAANALRAGQHVVWVDAAGAPLVARRFNDVLFDAPAATGQRLSPPHASPAELQSRFHHVTAATLAHLLALFARPPPSFPPPNTSLVVIDSLSTLFDNAYPRNADDRGARNKSDQARWAAGRKYAVLNELISMLTRAAALHDIALLLTCQTITRIRGGSRALLVPALSGAEWEAGISTRLVLFRDWVPGQGKWTEADADRLQKARFVGVVKANGVAMADEGGVGSVVPFAVESAGLCDMNIAAVDIAAAMLPTQIKPPKRSFTDIGDDEYEDADSDELYGWIEDDEVAAEGLLTDELAIRHGVNAPESRATPHAEPSTGDVAERPSKKVVRPATY
ncbi:P-loop containing nucleoside triphosphate hydrolase protein [Massariosphaeria phaeospora]|uniref:P-loop containing nucleoside triphosphate hydrolase protein n=1 Tax=Massariosphaeria phaeospora TaxID=100035 RepID=A0A7C8MG73_9PLEO|nr:P-loop containing nucleoside triphosphate hydrolase protein [Massariosphaeria phaeospora]